MYLGAYIDVFVTLWSLMYVCVLLFSVSQKSYLFHLLFYSINAFMHFRSLFTPETLIFASSSR